MQKGGRSQLEHALAATLDRRRSHATLRSLTTKPASSVDFSSNDFLSLATSSELRDIFRRELDDGPSTKSLGSGGSRLLDGNSTYAEKLETDIASFHGAEAGLLCNSGFDANVGLFSCLPQPGDVIIYDEYIHASVHDGMKLSRAGECIPFAHNCVQGLREVLEHYLSNDDAMQDGRRNVFIALEAVYSMDGDVAPLAEIADLVELLLPKGNGHIIVDEAHSTGVFGTKGTGLVCELGLEKRILVRLHTFGKALACNGAILLCSPTIRQYLLNYARPLIYTTFMSFPALAAIRASYAFLMDGKTEPLARNLGCLIQALHTRLLDLEERMQGHADMQRLLQVPADCPRSPIFSVLSSEPKALAAYCQGKGFVVRGIVPPTVPAGAERIRICLHPGNTVVEIEALVAVIADWLRLRTAADDHTSRPRARL